MKNKNLKLACITVLVLLGFVLVICGIGFLIVFIDRNNYGFGVFCTIMSLLLIRDAYLLAREIIENGL